MILEELFKNNDAYYLSVHLWSDAGGKLRFAPWDFDLTLGYPYYDCGATGFVGRAAFVDALAASPTVRQRLVANWLCPASSWEEEHSRVLAWFPERTAWLDTHVGSL